MGRKATLKQRHVDAADAARLDTPSDCGQVSGDDDPEFLEIRIRVHLQLALSGEVICSHLLCDHETSAGFLVSTVKKWWTETKAGHPKPKDEDIKLIVGTHIVQSLSLKLTDIADGRQDYEKPLIVEVTITEPCKSEH